MMDGCDVKIEKDFDSITVKEVMLWVKRLKYYVLEILILGDLYQGVIIKDLVKMSDGLVYCKECWEINMR